MPAATPEPTTTASTFAATVLSGAVIAAIVSGTVTTALARRATRLEQRARVRTTLAEAYQAYADYKEFPYAIRRRRHDQGPEERIRLSEEIRQVQSRLSYYEAWTRVESPETGDAYNKLVTELRRVAGASMQEAWRGPSLDNDPGMNIGINRVDLSSLKAVEDEFLRTASSHVKAVAGRRLRRIRRPPTDDASASG